ncbi:MAG: bacillithiol biosynthesis cysteine-adding enzyme BshC [Candidatus Kapaibacterium sp.]
MKSVNFSRIPGFSELFRDFIAQNVFFNKRFPSNKSILNNEFRPQWEGDRPLLASAISRSNKNSGLNDNQKSALEKLMKNNTYAVVTGQQAGFLGGPLYTLLKAHSAIAAAKKLNRDYAEYEFLPVFWVEDNDHDNQEASHVYVYDYKFRPQRISCSTTIAKEDPTSVSELEFDAEVSEAIDYLAEIIRPTQYKDELFAKLREIYAPGKNWSDAFIEFYNYIFSDENILFVKASEIRKMGMFDRAAKLELDKPAKTKELVESANELIEKEGYSIQAKISEVNLFWHESGKRLKIKSVDGKYEVAGRQYSSNELIAALEKRPGLFSPNVLLRPVFQDLVIPTAAYIGGPSEIGYLTQTPEMYEYFDVRMPAVLPRHSATLINMKFDKFLADKNINREEIFDKFADTERLLNKEFSDTEIEKYFDEVSGQIADIYKDAGKFAARFEPSLRRSAESLAQKSMNILSALEQKTQSAAKNRHEQEIEKFRQASDFLYPRGTPQERLYSPVNFAVFEGFGMLNEKIAAAASLPADHHYFIDLFD